MLVSELSVGSTYEVLITTPSGLYSYRIGDLLRLERNDPPVFSVVGRTRTTLNLFGEKVCEEHISAAVRAAEDTTRATIAEYSCMAEGNGRVGRGPRYVLCVEFIKSPKDKRKFIMTWDKKLQEIAPGYGCFRANDAMLKPPEIVAVTRGTFQRYEQRRMRDTTSIGQFKLPHVGVGTDLLGELQVAP